MATSPELEKANQMFRTMGEKLQTLKTTDEIRGAYEDLVSGFPVADDVICERVGANGVPSEWISAPGAAEDKVLLYLHGGGYVIGSTRTHREMVSRLSRASGSRALAIDYRLAPENPFPAAVEDSISAYRWLLSNGIKPNRITIAGDSAGGGLTVSTLVALRYLGEPMPAAAIPISPWVDMEGIGESMTTKAEVDPVVTLEGLQFMAQTYMGDMDRRTPLAAPLYADLSGLPPLLIHVGTAEVLLDDATRLAERAKAAGVEVEIEAWDDMPHVWHAFAAILPEGQQAIERIGEFIRKHTN